MSEDLEEIFKCINEARVPSMWSKTYPSLKPLGSWTRDLVQRVDQVSTATDVIIKNLDFKILNNARIDNNLYIQ